MRDRYIDIFREEARELLEILEEALLELEETPADTEPVARAFRALHTIKGSGAMFGFKNIAALAHEMEAVFQAVRAGRVAVSRNLVDMGLAVRDCMRTLLEDLESEAQEVPAGLLNDMRSLLGTSAAPQGGGQPSPSGEEPHGSSGETTYRIRFTPSPTSYTRGVNPVFLTDELREMGKCFVVAHADRIPSLPEFDVERCYTSWDVILTTEKGAAAIRDVFIFVEDDAELVIDALSEVDSGEESAYKRLGEILMERGNISSDELNAVLREQELLGEMLVERGLVRDGAVDAALMEQHVMRERLKERRERDESRVVRVPSQKLDKLVDLVGELVTVQAQLAQHSTGEGAANLRGVSEQMESLITELHDNAMSLRMVPIGSLFGKFRRLVRDLSSELGREVAFVTEGEETELDKNVIERLNEPLVHVIRNCIDHGIEPPDVREGKGKPRQGTLRVQAIHSGSHVVVVVGDDGAGLDFASIRQRAVQEGLIAPDAPVHEQELSQFIFAQGFSTVRSVSEVSGRGVGMDVVKKGVESLRGTVEVQSEEGKGTAFILRLPLTVAIIEGLLVRVGPERFVFPLASVEECIEVSQVEMSSDLRRLLSLRGHPLPYVVLREVFGSNGSVPLVQQVVVSNVGGDEVGFVVDEVIGEHHTVIKPLGAAFKKMQGFSGATILGDGSIALIIDAARLYEHLDNSKGGACERVPSG
jgi:two-component system chemotaxis sensor kinase CheA